MNPTLPRSLTLALLVVLAAATVRADDAAYAQILKERDSLLMQILAEQQDRRQSGQADDAAVQAAQLALDKFRRDTATTLPEKIRQQEDIVSVQEARLATVKSQFQIGTGTHIDVLQATDAVLHAKQVLEKLWAGADKH